MLTIEKVIYNPPATIILWNDGTKTMAKCDEEDTYDRATGFMLCVLKKKYGNKTVKKMFNRYVYDIPPKNSKGVIIVTQDRPKVRKPKMTDDLHEKEYDINELLDEFYKLFTE